MKISIIGPSGSGKTHLAKKISERFKIKNVNLDYVFFKYIADKSRIELSETEWKRKLNKVLKEDNWIIEGVNPILEVFEHADKIIYLRPPLLHALYSQWKRYFTDSKQRKEHGLVNNLKLSRYIVRQYIQEPDPKQLKNPKHSRVKKTDKLVSNYKHKLVLFRNRREVNQFLKNPRL